MRRSLLALALLASTTPLAACDDAPPAIDAGQDAAGPGDSGPPDGGAACVAARDGGPLPARDAGPPLPPPELDCGEPELPAGTPLRRAPYLQSVTTTSARVAWTSTGGGPGHVRFTSDPAAGTWTDAPAQQEAFAIARTGDTVDYVAYDATLTGLEAGRAYCYEVWEGDTVLARNLRMDVAWEGTERPMRILAFGDSGTGSEGQLALRDRMLTGEYDLMIHLGDMGYSAATFPVLEANYFGVYREIMHRVPTFPAIGNHEYLAETGQPYVDVHYLFENAWREEDRERYYSFDWGNVHFVSLDSNETMLLPIAVDRAGRMTDDMLDWARDDLAASDAEWKIAFFHHPPFTSSTRGPSRVVLEHVVPVLEEGGVDLVLVGHDHHYERTVPISELCDASGAPTAIPYVVAGGGGAGLRDIEGESWFTRAYEDQRHTFVSLTIHGCSATAEVLTPEGDVVDEWMVDGCD